MDLKSCKHCKHLRYISNYNSHFPELAKYVKDDNLCNKNNKLIEFIEPGDCKYESNIGEYVGLILKIVGAFTILGFIGKLLKIL